MSRQHELRRDLHFAVGVVLEGREVRLVFVGVDLFPVSVVGCRGRRERRRGQRCSEGVSETQNAQEVQVTKVSPRKHLKLSLRWLFVNFLVTTRRQNITAPGKKQSGTNTSD